MAWPEATARPPIPPCHLQREGWRDSFPGLADDELPRYVRVSDFERFRLTDLEGGTHAEFALADLLAEISRFGFLAMPPALVRAHQALDRAVDRA